MEEKENPSAATEGVRVIDVEYLRKLSDAEIAVELSKVLYELSCRPQRIAAILTAIVSG